MHRADAFLTTFSDRPMDRHRDKNNQMLQQFFFFILKVHLIVMTKNSIIHGASTAKVINARMR